MKNKYRYNIETSFNLFQLYVLINNSPGITQKEISNKLGRTKFVLSEQLRPLKQEGYIRQKKKGQTFSLFINKKYACPCCGRTIK